MSENTDDFEIDLGELPSTSDEVEIDLGPLGEESEPREEEITLADEPEEVVEVRNNTRKTVTRCVLPGYVLVRMELTDDSWATVRHTPSVTGFVGHGQTPVPLSLDEVVSMLTPSVVAKVAAEASTSVSRAKKKVEVVDFAVGDSVMVTDGPFTGVHATITEISANQQRLRALVEILGRETPVDLEFKQVEKVG